MEKGKNEFQKWMESSDVRLAHLAFRYQWKALLYATDEAYFSSTEMLWMKPEHSAFGLSWILEQDNDLIPSALEVLEQEVSIPIEVYTALMGMISYRLKNEAYVDLVYRFIVRQDFEEKRIYPILDSVLRCVERLPKWKNFGLELIDKAPKNEDYCLMLQHFLIDWGYLSDQSNELLEVAFEHILPEWAPKMIGAIDSVSGPYRFNLSLKLFKKYFGFQKNDLIEEISKVFVLDTDVELQQQLLDGLFNYLNDLPKEEIGEETARLFLQAISCFLSRHWSKNCFKLNRFWEKFQYDLEMFQICRKGFKNDKSLVLFADKSDDSVAKLKTPLHMMCYISIIQNADLCCLLLTALTEGTRENRNLAIQLLLEKGDFLQLSESVEDYLKTFDTFWMRCDKSYEMKIFLSYLVNSMVEYGPDVKNLEEVLDFVQRKALNVPAFFHRYEKEIKVLEDNKKAYKEVISFLEKA